MVQGIDGLSGGFFVFCFFAYGYSISSVTFVESLSLLYWIALYFDKAIVLYLGSVSVLPLRIGISNPLDFCLFLCPDHPDMVILQEVFSSGTVSLHICFPFQNYFGCSRAFAFSYML